MGEEKRFFEARVRHFSRRDKVTMRMRTPQLEKGLEVCAAKRA
jgi:hypothetical protein